MTLPDLEAIRTSPATRSLLLGRAVAATLHREGWSVRKGAAHGAGVADAAAEKSWFRKNLQVRVRLLVRCHHGERIVFSRSETRAAVLHRTGERMIPDALLAQAGLDPATIVPIVTPLRIAPPRSRAGAYAFREPREANGSELFRTAADEAFAAPAAIEAEIAAYDADVLMDDLNALADSRARAEHVLERLTALARHTELLHSIVVTDAALWTVTDEQRIARVSSLRLYRSRVATAECSWIDVVHADAFPAYAASASRHYTSAMRRRGLE